MTPRWSVCIGGPIHHWQPPIIQTDDLRMAIEHYHTTVAFMDGVPMVTVAIFDGCGDGEPLCPESAQEQA